MSHTMSRREFLRHVNTGFVAGGILIAIGSKNPFDIKESWLTIDHTKKEELKNYITWLQRDIKKDKVLIAQRSRAGQEIGNIASNLCHKQTRFRHYQIAYSELQGRKREQIEKPAYDNRPDERTIRRIKLYCS
jgi:hypothetical protein